ncbi:MAG: ATP-binding protein [Gammaproteobacteria bacterium]|nr:ATP-binding protein [Gammaproteobacteria bacterium]
MSSTIIQKIIYPSDISNFSANNIKNAVIRDSLLSTIEMKFEGKAKIVIVSGNKGMGKSVLLNQFLKRNKNKCIALFIDVINKQSYCEDNIITDLYRQTSFYVNGVEPNLTEHVGKKQLNEKLYLLDIYLKKNHKNIYFLIDGLDEVPQSDQYIVKNIITHIPHQILIEKSFLCEIDHRIIRNRSNHL